MEVCSLKPGFFGGEGRLLGFIPIGILRFSKCLFRDRIKTTS